jgi:FkbM family methyltransferase
MSAKSAARALLPPIIGDAIKRSLQKVRRSKPLVVPGSNRRLEHRGSQVDYEIYEQIFLHRVYDIAFLRRASEITAFYENQDRPLIVDCGANIGASSLWFATCFPRARIIAVEPETTNFSLLSRNAEEANVRAIHGAVSGHSGTLQLVDPGLGSAGFRVSDAGCEFLGPEVRAYTLDELVGWEPGMTPFILKIDIEGAEEHVFRANCASAHRFPLVIVELHDWMLPGMATSQPFLAWHAAHGRDLIQKGENSFSLSNSFANRPDALPSRV